MPDDVGTQPGVYCWEDSRNSDERCAPGAEAGVNCRKRTVRRGSEPSFRSLAAPGPLIDKTFAARL